MLGRFGPQFGHAVHAEVVDGRAVGVMELSGGVTRHVGAGLRRRRRRRVLRVGKVGKVSGVMMLTRRARRLDATRRELIVALIVMIAADGFPDDVTTFLRLWLLVAARVIAAVIGPISRISRPLAASAANASAASAVLVVVFLITFVAARQLMRRFQ